MSSQPVIDNARPGRFEWLLLHGLFYSLLCLVLGPLTLAVAFYLKQYPLARKIQGIALILAIFWLVFLPLLSSSWLLLWLYTVPTSPLALLLIQGFNDIARLLKPKTLQEYLTAEEQAAKVEDRQLSQKPGFCQCPP